MATTNSIAFKTKEISASSRASIKIGDSYFTFEASETRTVDFDSLPSELNEANEAIEAERIALFETVNAQVDNQIQELQEYVSQKKQK